MNYLVDSNIFIYASKPEDTTAFPLLVNIADFYFSPITLIEVLGYNKLKLKQKSALEQIFSAGTELELSKEIVDKAIELRQEKMMSLGDAIIAATAICNDLTLLTRNIDDFKHLTDLPVENPYEES